MSIVLSMLFMVSILPPIPVFADYEGSCGEGVYYSLDQSTGTLTISGHGKMENYLHCNRAPWSEYNDSIKSVTIENGVTSIGDGAFKGCKGLTSITIPSSVKEIGCEAFSGCSGLTSIAIPSSVTKIGLDEFSGCSCLEAINVDELNTNYKSINGILFSKDGTQLFKYPEGKKDPFCTIPYSVTEIGICAFEGCSGLEAINVDESNTKYRSINGVLFSKDSTKLIKCPEGKKETCYTIPSSVTSIEFCAFYGCSGLEAITIPSSVKYIGGNAFWLK